MKQGSLRLVATAAALLALALPATLDAANWRGADLIVTRQDGRQVRGELVAVKPETLVLLAVDAKVESVPLAEIGSIKIVRRSGVWQGLLAGFAAGAVAGAIWGGISAGEEWGVAGGAFLGGLLFAGPGSLLGLVAGMGAGLDDKIDLAGLPEPELSRVLAKLSRLAREPEAYVARSRVSTPGAAGARPALSRYERTRFRLTWTPGYRVGGRGYAYDLEDVSFRFIGDLPPGEAGPYAASSYFFGDRPRFAVGRIALSYAWSRQLAAEIELYAPKRSTDHRSGDLSFTSTLDGLLYSGYFVSYEDVSSTSLLVGVSFRPISPAFLSPHSVELGVAAGPAWVSWRGRSIYSYSPGADWTDSRRTTTLTARARVSYDFYFNPAFSMGAFAEYRWAQADIPSYSRTELQDFYETSRPDIALARTTEVTFPARRIALGGLALGLRFGVSF